jgi:hypothetical protein
MAPVLAMLELDGDTAALLDAGDDLERRLPQPEGLIARLVAPTDTGIVLLQLWASPQDRERNATSPAHAEALQASGITKLVTGSRARAFDGAVLQVF